MDSSMDDEKLTTSEVADRLGVSVATVRRRIASGQLVAERDAGRWLVWASSLDQPAVGSTSAGEADSDAGRGSTDSGEPPGNSGENALGRSSRSRLDRLADRLPIRLQRERHLRQLIRDSRRYFLLHDAEWNAETSLRDDQRLRFRVMFIAEIHTPATIGRLINGLSDLKPAWGMDRNPAQWVRRSRATAAVGGWTNVGGVTREEGLLSMIMPLPAAVRYAHIALRSFGPNATGLMVAFELAEEAGLRPDHAIRRHYSTRPVRIARGISEDRPFQQKERAFFEALDGLRRECATWVHDRFGTPLPADGRLPPTAFVLTTRNARAMSDDIPPDFHLDWSFLTRLNGTNGTWSDSGLPGWRVNDRWGSHGSDERMLLFAAEEEEIATSNDLSSYGKDFDIGLARWAVRALSTTVALWSLTRTLDAFHQSLGNERDAAHSPQQRGSPGKLDATRRRLLRISLDARLLAEDLREFSAQSVPFLFDSIAFDTPATRRRKENFSLAEHWRRAVAWQAERVLALQAAVRDVLGTDAELRTAIVNVKVQRSVQRLTWIILVLTAVALFLAARTN